MIWALIITKEDKPISNCSWFLINSCHFLRWSSLLTLSSDFYWEVSSCFFNLNVFDYSSQSKCVTTMLLLLSSTMVLVWARQALLENITQSKREILTEVPDRAWNRHELGWHGKDLASYFLQWPSSVSWRTSSSLDWSSFEPKSQPRKNDPDHVQDIQHSCDVCCRSSCPLIVCFEKDYWNCLGFWRRSLIVQHHLLVVYQTDLSSWWSNQRKQPLRRWSYCSQVISSLRAN